MQQGSFSRSRLVPKLALGALPTIDWA